MMLVMDQNTRRAVAPAVLHLLVSSVMQGC